MQRSIRWLVLCCALGAAPHAAAGLTQLTDLFVFGDDLSDGGNSGLRSREFTGKVLPIFPPEPYFNGQYSNGPVAVEYLWRLYNPGDPGAFAPSLAGGTNYAIGGATTGTANFNSVNPSVPSTLTGAFVDRGAAWQLEQFADTAPAFDPATSLFVVWLFPNDLFYFDATGELPGTVPLSPRPGRSTSWCRTSWRRSTRSTRRCP